jgi:hypothetical protein
MQFNQKLLAYTISCSVLLHAAPTVAADADYCNDRVNSSVADKVSDSLWQQTKNRLGMIVDEGGDAIYLSGYAHHGRHTYTPDRLNELNEKNWGGGYGKTLRNAAGNDESLYFMAISDSHKQAQLMAGYAYEWIWPIADTGLEAGLGYTAILVSRADYFGRAPFPIALPLASIGVKKAKLLASYVPRLSANKGNGDVLFLFMRVELN